MTYITPMKKQFDNRAKLSVYVENGDLELMTEKARTSGKLLSEWARETLLRGLGDKSILERGRVDGQGNGGGRVDAKDVQEGHPEFDSWDHSQGVLGLLKNHLCPVASCPHGLEPGWRCTLCGGIVK
jgi:hypothetical protein